MRARRKKSRESSESSEIKNQKDVFLVFDFTALIALIALAVLNPLEAQAVDLSTLPTNTWVETHPTYVNVPPGGANISFLAPNGYNNKGIYDPTSQRVMVYDKWVDPVRGASIYANALLSYDPVGETVTMINESNWVFDAPPPANVTAVDPELDSAMIPLPANTSQPSPVPRHPVQNLAIVPLKNRVYLGPGFDQEAWNDSRFEPTDTWAFDLNQKAWSVVNDTSPYSSNVFYGGTALVYDSVNQVLVAFATKSDGSGQVVWHLDPMTNQWTLLPDAPGGPSQGDGNGVAYDSKRGLIMDLGGGLDPAAGTQELWSYNAATHEWKRKADCPMKVGGPGFDYDSNHDIFLALVSTYTWIYSPATDSWSQMNAPIARVPIGTPNLAGQPVTYDAAHDVFVFEGGNVGDAPPQWIVFRYSAAPSAPTITQAPASLSVSAGSNASFTVFASGTPPPSYQWQINTGSGWVNAGSNAAVFTMSNVQLSDSGTQVSVKVSNGNAPDAISVPVTLTVTPALPPVATPQVSPATDQLNLNSPEPVTITCATSGALIYYTTDGSDPTQSSTLYPSSALTLSVNTILKVRAFANGFNPSPVVGPIQFTFAAAAGTVATPTFNPPGGSFTGTGSVQILDTTPNAYIYYTLDGSIPTFSSPLYGGSISLNQTTTVKAIAYVNGMTISAMGSAVFTQTGSGGGSNPPTNPTPVTYQAADLSQVRVYPNPWRKDKHASHPSITFANLPAGATVKLFTVSGHKVKAIGETGGQVSWDLTNDSGDKVASGIYVYLITVGDTGYGGSAQKLKGKVAVIK